MTIQTMFKTSHGRHLSTSAIRYAATFPPRASCSPPGSRCWLNGAGEKTGMPAILVEDDASGWYESGVVRNMTISRNTFIQCGEAVIQIVPHAPRPEGDVHRNITITGNTFDLKNGTAIRIRHTGDVKAEKNTFTKDGKKIPEEKAVDIR